VPNELPSISPTQVSDQQLSASQLKNAVDNSIKSCGSPTEVFASAWKLIDSDTGDVLRQYPSDMLAISKSIENLQQGMLLKQQA